VLGVMPAMVGFRSSFPVVALLTACVAVLLSVRQTRRSLARMEELKRGNRKVAEKDFDTRQYLPKRSDLSEYSQAELNKIALRLNQRPRKTLGFRCPADKLDDLLR